MDDRWMAERACSARRPSVNLVDACSCRDAVADGGQWALCWLGLLC